MSDNTVTMSLASYNQIKAENTRFQMFVSRLWESAELKQDNTGIEFDAELVEQLMRLMYPESYKKKLSTLRGQQTKLNQKMFEMTRAQQEVER